MNILIKNGLVVNRGTEKVQDVLIKNGKIEKVSNSISTDYYCKEIDASGLLVLPGVIDDQVHFREPGLTQKATIFTESRAAVAGGITSFMEMPNTVPNTLTQKLLQDKYDIAKTSSIANYSFFMGASNDNLEEVLKTNKKKVCGVKVFMGSSTGNMLVDKKKTLDGIFSNCDMLIATHCEDENTIKQNIANAKALYGENVPMEQHPIIRSHEACYLSSSMAVDLAKKHNTRLHILHISTAKELELFDSIPMKKKRITAEVCVHHLWFTDQEYKEKGTSIKWNPSVKTKEDRNALWKGIKEGKLDIIATDHAPHTIEEKNNTYFKAPSGGPLVQHALIAMLQKSKEGYIDLPEVVNMMAHKPAKMFDIKDRGFIDEGKFADLVLVNPKSNYTVNKKNILYKCGWSPFEGTTFNFKVEKTFVNGSLVFDNETIIEGANGQRLLFER